MRLVAIYIEEHEYLFDKPQTINFGGKYIYSFKNEEGRLSVHRKLNGQFISGFFDLEYLESKLTLVSTIAGQNGAGKSSVMDVIRCTYVQHRYSMPHHKSLLLFEKDELNHPVIGNSDFSNVILKLNKTDKDFDDCNNLDLFSVPLPELHQSIYFSPHFDYKFNPNFDEVDSHDISFDKILEEDLEELPKMDTNSNGSNYSINQELLFKNSLRQNDFLNSTTVKKNKIFQDIFHLPEHSKPQLTFRGYQPVDSYHTPYTYRTALGLIKKRITDELGGWHEQRVFDKKSTLLNQVEINKFILKRKILNQLVNLLEKVMERQNHYLSEGVFDTETFNNEIKIIDKTDEFTMKSEKYLLSFLKLAKLGKSTKSVFAFDADIVEEFLTKIFNTIDKADSEDDITLNDTLFCSKEDVNEILTIQRKLINHVNHYYHRFNSKQSIISKRDKIQGFVNYMPFNTPLSSGENALLNLFSRLYAFLYHNFIDGKTLEVKNHYILLLDEGDLGFHPTWKKKYVNALCKTIPHFFNFLKEKPSFQIILTTHDPLTLSDLPNSNVVYIERSNYSEKSNILISGRKNRPIKTFGANVSDLIADSFFIEGSLMGDFAHKKIKDTIEWLNNADFEDRKKYKTIIKLIDEPILQRKLAEMYDDKMETKLEVQVIDKQIKYLELLKKKLKK